MHGFIARAKLLSGTEPLKHYYPSDPRNIQGWKYTKQGNWIDVVQDFNSVSPNDVVTTFVNVIKVS